VLFITAVHCNILSGINFTRTTSGNKRRSERVEHNLPVLRFLSYWIHIFSGWPKRFSSRYNPEKHRPVGNREIRSGLCIHARYRHTNGRWKRIGNVLGRPEGMFSTRAFVTPSAHAVFSDSPYNTAQTQLRTHSRADIVAAVIESVSVRAAGRVPGIVKLQIWRLRRFSCTGRSGCAREISAPFPDLPGRDAVVIRPTATLFPAFINPRVARRCHSVYGHTVYAATGFFSPRAYKTKNTDYP